MDHGRLRDIERLQAIIDNPFKSNVTRYRADQAKQDIVASLKDRKLRKYREQLLAAARAGDLQAEWRISSQLRDYLKKEKHEEYQ